MRDIEDGHTEIALNNRLLGSMNSTHSAFLDPIWATRMVYVTAKSPKKNLFLHFHVIQAFDSLYSWVYFLLTIIFVLCWQCLDSFIHQMTQNHSKQMDITKTLLLIIGAQSLISVHVNKKLPMHQSILLASLLMFSLVTSNAFQGMIVSNLRRPKVSDINTLEDLLNSNKELSAFIIIPDLFKPNEDGSNVNQIQKKIYFRQKVDTKLTPSSILNQLADSKNAIMSKFAFFTEFN